MTIDTRRKLYDTVVLSGGCTMLPGLPTRLEQELRDLYLQHTLKVPSCHPPTIALYPQARVSLPTRPPSHPPTTTRLPSVTSHYARGTHKART